MASFANKDGMPVVSNMIAAIVENKQHLSDIDGLIGDGDHGINMSKGFSRAAERFDRESDGLSSSLKTLAAVLVEESGGAMGPLYGSLFRAMFKASREHETIDEKVFSDMLNGALAKVCALGGAEVGDKTLVDSLAPAVGAFDRSIADGGSFPAALDAMKSAAEAGRDSTKSLVARKGRASRLGERSKGVLDPGATSCCLVLVSMADTIQQLIGAQPCNSHSA